VQGCVCAYSVGHGHRVRVSGTTAARYSQCDSDTIGAHNINISQLWALVMLCMPASFPVSALSGQLSPASV
jgi:hypothetical protein